MVVAFIPCFECKHSVYDHARHCPFNPNFLKFSEEDKEMLELNARKVAYREMAASRRGFWAESRTSTSFSPLSLSILIDSLCLNS